MGFAERRKAVADAVLRTFGEDAVYIDRAGVRRQIVIRRIRPSEAVRFGEGSVMMDLNQFEVQRSIISLPATGDMLVVMELDDRAGIERETQYSVIGAPEIDSGRQMWTVTIEPVRF